MTPRGGPVSMPPTVFDALVEAWVAILMRDYDERYPVRVGGSSSVTIETPPAAARVAAL